MQERGKLASRRPASRESSEFRGRTRSATGVLYREERRALCDCDRCVRCRDGHARPVKDDVTYTDAVPEEDGYVCEVKGWWDRTDWNWTKEEKQAFADKYDDTVGTIEKVDENIKMCHRFGISLEEFEACRLLQQHPRKVDPTLRQEQQQQRSREHPTPNCSIV